MCGGLQIGHKLLRKTNVMKVHIYTNLDKKKTVLEYCRSIYLCFLGASPGPAGVHQEECGEGDGVGGDTNVEVRGEHVGLDVAEHVSRQGAEHDQSY